MYISIQDDSQVRRLATSPSSNTQNQSMIKINPQEQGEPLRISKLQQFTKKLMIVQKFLSNLRIKSHVLSADKMEKLNKFDLSSTQSLSLEEKPSLLPMFEVFSFVTIFWDYFMFFTYLLQLWFIPFLICFYRSNIQLTNLKYAFLIIIIMNILIQINRKVIIQGKLIKIRKQTLNYYIENNYISDTILILNWICLINQSTKLKYQISILIFGSLSIYYCIKLLQGKSSIYFDKIQFKDQTCYVINISVLIIKLYFLAHYFACLWYFMGDLCSSLNIDSWISEYGFSDEITFVKYNYALYWAATTISHIGYGDITPRNDYELFLSNILMILSICTYGYIINEIRIIFKDNQKNTDIINNQLKSINTYMQENQTEDILQYQIRNYLNYQHQNNKQYFQDSQNIIHSLPNELKNNLKRTENQKIINNMLFLQKYFSQSLLKMLIDHLIINWFQPDQQIYNHYSNDLFFVNQGCVSIQQIKWEKEIEIIQKGNFFNEISFFTEKNYDVIAISKNFTQIIQIKKEIFISLLQKCSNDQITFKKIVNLINNKNDSSIFEKQCNFCGKFNHQTINCSLLQWNFSSMKLVANQKSINNERVKFDRKERKNQDVKKIDRTIFNIQLNQNTEEDIQLKYDNGDNFIEQSNNISQKKIGQNH